MLFHEVGVEPKAMLDLALEPYIRNAFGLNKGRLISRLPRDWLGEVRRQINQMPDSSQKMRIKNLINNQHFLNLIVDFDRPNIQGPWLDAVLKEHQLAPFSFVVSADEHRPPDIFDVSHIHDLIDASDSEVGFTEVKSKNSQQLTNELSPFLRVNKSITLVNSSQSLVSRDSRASSAELFKEVFARWQKFGGIEFKVIVSIKRVNFVSDCEKLGQYLLKQGFKGAFKFIAVQDETNRLHERYLLGPHSGIELGYGLETSTRSQSWKILNKASFLNHKRRFMDLDIRDEYPEYEEFIYRNSVIKINSTLSNI
jgi:hypothetical protein